MYVDGQRVGEMVLTRQRLQLRGRRAARVQADDDHTAALKLFRCPLHGRRAATHGPQPIPQKSIYPFRMSCQSSAYSLP